MAGKQALAMADSLYRDGKYEAAIDTLAAATVDEADYLGLAYLLGLCYARLKRFDEALLYLEQVVTHGDGGARLMQCRMSLAYVYSATGRSRLAEYELQKLIESSVETPQVCSALGHAHWKQGRLEDGLLWYSKALALEPDNPTALNGYGYLLACAERDLEKALTCCRKALDGDPNNPAYADSMGWTCLKLGRLEEAGQYLRSAAIGLGENEELRAHLQAYEKAVQLP
jgi:Flp pilus assembly protein TadD